MATVQDKIAGLYAAFFNRAPDKAGFDLWVDRLSDGTNTLQDIAAGFAGHPVFETTYGSMDDKAFVNAIYTNMLGSTADAGGLAYYTNKLATVEGYDRADMVAEFIGGVLDADMSSIDLWPGLSQAEFDAAVVRQNLMKNKVAVSQNFMEQLAEYTNVQDGLNPESDPAYIASQNILSGVTADASTVTTATNLITALATDPSIAIATINEIVETNGSITDDASVIDNAQTAVNTAPVLPEMTSVAYAENVTVAAGTVVATAAATDADGQTLTYSLVGDARFAINAQTGAITVVADTTFDYETETSVALTVSATDGITTVTTPLAINVTDEAATYTLTADATTAKDGDTVSFTFTAVESDVTEITYTLTGLTADKVVGGSLTGTATVVNGEAVVTVTLLADTNVSAVTATTVVDGQTVSATTSVVEGANTAVTVTTTEIAIAGDAGEFVTKTAGDTGNVTYTVNSSSADASLNAKVVINGDANITVNSGTGSDTIIIDGTGNNVINAGDGADKIYLNSGNDVVVIGTTGHFDLGSIIDGGEGINTIRVSGTNDLTVKTVVDGAGNDTIASARISNIQNLIIEDGARVTISKDFLSTLSHVTVLGTTAQLTITGDTDSTVETIDLTNVLTGTLGKLTVGITQTESDGADDVSIYLTEAQINNITTFAIPVEGSIMTDEAGAAALAAKGVTPDIDGGEATLQAATSANLAGVDYLVYEVNVGAEEAFDQLYLNGTAADQIRDGGATTIIAGTATVAQAIAIVTNATALDGKFAVADTAANIYAAINAGGVNDDWLSQDVISSLTLTTAASVTQAALIFDATGLLKTAVTAAANDEDETTTLTLPTYSITDSGAALATGVAATKAIIQAASSIAVTSAAVTAADATTIMTNYASKLSTGFNITDGADELYALSATVRNAAINITANEALTVVQAVRIDGFNNTGTTTFSITDDGLALANASTAILDAATAVVINPGQTLNVAQATKLLPYLADSSVFTINDTAANLTSANGLALIENFTHITVTSSDAATLAQAVTLHDVVDGVNQTLTAPSITDAATTILTAITTQAGDSLGNHVIDTDATDAAKAAITAAPASGVTATGNMTVANATTLKAAGVDVYYVSDTAAHIAAGGATIETAKTVTVEGTATAAQAVAIAGLDATNTNCTISYAISDTLAEIATTSGANGANPALIKAATSITVTDSVVSYADAVKVAALNTTLIASPAKTALAYAIEDTYASLNGLDANASTDAAYILLNSATNVTVEDTGLNIKALASNTGVFALVDNYKIVADIDDLAAELHATTGATSYYTNTKTTSITFTDSNKSNISVAEAKSVYGTTFSAYSDTVKAKIAFANIEDTAAHIIASSEDATETVVVGKAQIVTVSDSTINVAAVNSVAALVPTGADLVVSGVITDTAANLVTVSNDILAVSAGVEATNTATVAQYQTLLTKLEAAELLVRDSGVLVNSDLADLVAAAAATQTTLVAAAAADTTAGTAVTTAQTALTAAIAAADTAEGDTVNTNATISTGTIVVAADGSITATVEGNPATTVATNVAGTITLNAALFDAPDANIIALIAASQAKEDADAAKAITAAALTTATTNDTAADAAVTAAGTHADTITLTTTVTVAQAIALNSYNVDSLESIVTEGATTTALNTVYISDSIANILNEDNVAAVTKAGHITVTNAINISKAQQLVDLAQSSTNIADTDAAAIAATDYAIEEELAYFIAAYTDNMNTDLLGNSRNNEVTITDVGTFEMYEAAADEWFISGTVAQLKDLPAELLEVGFVVNDTVANITSDDGVTLTTADSAQGYIVSDVAANIIAAGASVAGAAALEVRVSDSVTAATFAQLQALGNANLSVAEVTGSATALAAATLEGTTDSFASLIITDATVTIAQMEAIETVTVDGVVDGTTATYSISDAKANIDFTVTGDLDTYAASSAITNADDAALFANAQAVTITGDLTVDQAGLAYDWNEVTTLTIKDDTVQFDELFATTASTVLAKQNQLAAVNAATTVSLNEGQVVTVAQATKLLAVAGFDGVYTLSDSAEHLAAASAELLADAVEVQVTNDASVAEAAILSVLTNIDKVGGSGTDANLANFGIADTAAAIAAAGASLLDNVKEVDISTTNDDEVVTASVATTLKGLINNTAIAWGDDTYAVEDTLANITASANSVGVRGASVVSVDGAITVAQATTVNTAANSTTTPSYELADNASALQAAVSNIKNNVTSVTVLDDITATTAAIINSAYTGATELVDADGSGNLVGEISFAKVTGTSTQLMATSNLLISQATTVDVTDAMTVAELAGANGTGFLTAAGTKLVGGYVVEDTADNIVNAALNNDFSNEVVTNATTVTLLTGEETMNVAASTVIIGLGNFEGTYNVSDSVENIALATTALINGSARTTVGFSAGVETFNANAYTAPITLDLSANSAAVTENATTIALTNVDTVTLKSGTAYTVDTGITPVHAQTAVADMNDMTANQFSVYYGYVTGAGFVVDNTIAEDMMLVYANSAGAEHAMVFSQTATLVVEDHLISGKANDTISLSSGPVDTIVFAASAALNGVDTISGFTVGATKDVLDFTNFAVTGEYNISTPVAAGSTAAVALAGLDNTVVLVSSADLANQTVTEAALFGAGLAFEAEGTTAYNFVLLVGETSGTAGVKAYYVTDGTGANDMTITQVATLSGISLSGLDADNIA